MLRLTRTQVDRLGDRLVAGPTLPDSEDYFGLRDAYAPALATIEERLRATLPEWPPVGRLKTLDSALAKLRRKEARRLSTMQDIAGCRIVVTDVSYQDTAVGTITTAFGDARVHDLRSGSATGYRAVHVVVDTEIARGFTGQVEIQVRTALQDDWAQVSEKLADLHGDAVKHGPVRGEIGAFLLRLSDRIREFEEAERRELNRHRARQILAEGATANPPDSRAITEIEELKRKLWVMLRGYLDGG
jgi:ppGpp synthetase/RelA/SpoT-type nucleotidyltranferase